MTIYKLKDEKWHIPRFKHDGFTDCGMDIYPNLVEERKIGRGTPECRIDPPVTEVCPKCFHFLPVFKEQFT